MLDLLQIFNHSHKRHSYDLLEIFLILQINQKNVVKYFLKPLLNNNLSSHSKKEKLQYYLNLTNGLLIAIIEYCLHEI